jgi:predicted nucleic acid-binding protein
VKAFLDTSVLVPTFYGDHEYHESSFELFRHLKKTTGCTAAHCLAEIYSVLTGMPGKDRVSPDEALLFLHDVTDKLTVVSLSDSEYFETLESAAAAGISGGTIYDAIIAACAVKAKAQTIYTWNVRHFKRCGDTVSARTREP